jgi:hypothetical protein
MNTALKEKEIGLLEIMLKNKKIEILVEMRGEKYKYYQKIDEEKSRSLGVFGMNPEDFSDWIGNEYQSRGINIKERKYTPHSYSTN